MLKASPDFHFNITWKKFRNSRVAVSLRHLYLEAAVSQRYLRSNIK